jgi:peptidyl-prolyl cis-trans isomerase B (cyclophilin B)
VLGSLLGAQDRPQAGGAGGIIVYPVLLFYRFAVAHPGWALLIGVVVSVLLALLAMWAASTPLRKVGWGVVWFVVPALVLLWVPTVQLLRGSHNPTSTGSESPSTAGSFSASNPLPPFSPPAGLGANCQYQPTPNQPAAKNVDPPKGGKVPTEPANVSMSITTSLGPIGVQLDNAKAPCTVNNFVSLAQQGYFNDTHCHRLTTGPTSFVLQCGDPKADGTGGPGYQFADEYPSNQYTPDDPARNNPVAYPRGTLAMANTGPGTNGSQFFIVYGNSELPPHYTVFGKVDDGDMSVLDAIAAPGTVDGSPDGKPKIDVVITSVRPD